MKIAICPGSFDPVTKGHLDIIRRTASMFDRVIVVVMHNYHKPNSYFSAIERVGLITRCVKDLDNVVVDMHDGLLAAYAQEKGAVAIVKGLRAVSDFDYEFQQALTNKKLNPNIETVFITANRITCTSRRASSSRFASSAGTSRTLSRPRCMMILSKE